MATCAFTLRPLANEADLPPSIPLVVPQDCQYDPVSFTITKSGAPSGGNQETTQSLVPKALEMLRSIEKPVAVLSICGPYRSGKSYFLSRVLGIPNAFDISHKMKACTRGIWMATTGLECDDFVVVFLDTEGTDDVGASENAMKSNFSLLVLTTLLSSCLIYNSMNIPKRTDLEAMSCFAQISSNITTGCAHREDHYYLIQEHFPKFVWLLRDVTLLPEDNDGEEIPITDYVKKHVLARSSLLVPSSCDHVVYTLLNLFPTFQCHTLPIPSTRRSVLKNINGKQSQLSAEFNQEVEKLKTELLSTIQPKSAFGSDRSYLTGPTLAALASKYSESLNTPDAVPDLLSSWQLVVGHEINRLTEELIEEYTQEMETALEGKYPIEEDRGLLAIPEVERRESTTMNEDPGSESPEQEVVSPLSPSLMDIHQHILDEKLGSLEGVINRRMAFSSYEERAELLEKLESRVVQYKRTPESNNVIGGELFRFVCKNRDESRKQCNLVFDEISNPLIENLSKDLDTLEQKYYSLAIGPAKLEVYVSRREEFANLADHLAPGPPLNMRCVGRATDRVKIRWRKPKHHSRGVKEYELQVSRKEHQWFTLATIRKHSVVVCSLKSSTCYCFRVRGINTYQVGQWSEEIEVKTRISDGERYGLAAASYIGGTLGAPFLLTAATMSEGIDIVKGSTTFKDKALASAGVVAGGALLPIMLAFSPVYSGGTGASIAHSVYESAGTSAEDDLDDTNSVCISIDQVNDECRDIVTELSAAEGAINSLTQERVSISHQAATLNVDNTPLVTTLPRPGSDLEGPETSATSCRRKETLSEGDVCAP